MKYIKMLSSLFILGFMASCEDIIELELDNTEPRIIIEANLDITKQSLEVIVSESNDFYEIAEPIFINDAEVTLIKNNSQVFELSSIDNIYSIDNIEISPSDEYEVEVDVRGQVYSAKSTVITGAQLQKLDTATVDIPFGPNAGDNTYQVFSSWRDVKDEQNFYRLRSYTNGTYDAGNYFLMNDDGFDGKLITRPIMFPFQAGDKVTMELLSTDRNYYEYYLALSTVQGEGLSSSIPFNPQGNFSNGALGYFGIYHSSLIEIQL